MRLKLIILLVFMAIAGAQSQDITLFGPEFNYTFTGETYHPNAGLNLEGMFGSRLSFNYSIHYGPLGSEQYYFHTGGGQALGVYLINKAIEDRNGLALAISLGVFSFVMPESITWRERLSNASQLGIYLAPYGYEAIKNTATDTADERTSYELGFKYYWTLNPSIYVVPSIGMKGFYGERALGASYGVSIQFKVNKK